MTGNIWYTAKIGKEWPVQYQRLWTLYHIHNVVKWLFGESDRSAAHYLGMLVLYPLSTRQALQ